MLIEVGILCSGQAFSLLFEVPALRSLALMETRRCLGVAFVPRFSQTLLMIKPKIFGPGLGPVLARLKASTNKGPWRLGLQALSDDQVSINMSKQK